MGVLAAIISVLLVFAALVGICLLAIKRGRDWPDQKFDERQKKAINEGYGVCFWVGFFYYMAVALAFIRLEAGEELAVSPFLLVYFGVMIQIAVLHIHDLLTHSAIPLSGKPKGDIIGWLITSGILFGGLAWVGNRYDGFPLKGEGVIKWVFLLSGMVSLLRAVGAGVTLLWKEKEDG